MESRKRGGRTKGTPNKVTAQIKEILSDVLKNELKKINSETLTIKDRIELVKVILPYIIPRLQTTYIEHEYQSNEITPISIEWK